MESTGKLKEVDNELKRLIKKTEEIRSVKSINYESEIGVENDIVDAEGIVSKYIVTCLERELKTVVMLLKEGFCMTEHNHIAEQEFIVISGSIDVVTTTGTNRLTKGEKIKVPSLVTHHFCVIEDSVVVSNMIASYQF